MTKQTSKKAAAAASTTLRNRTSGKYAKSAAGSALSQTEKKRFRLAPSLPKRPKRK